MVNKEYYKLGQKIRNFRKRAEKSQMDLEIEIGASAGSISRIENGEVNPTKETLLKIIESLNLISHEAASLFNLDFNELHKMVDLAKRLSNSLDLETTLQNGVNEIVFELKLLGAMIFLNDSKKVYLRTITETWYTRLVEQFLGTFVNTLSAPLNENEYSMNLIVRTINEKREFVTNTLSDFSYPVISKVLADSIQKVTGTKSIISMPLVNNNKVLGAVFFSKNFEDDFKKDMNILRAFTDHLASAIENARSHEKLKQELEILKNK